MDQEQLNVSRETLEKLQLFVVLVEKWTSKINLISKHSTKEIWDRHIIDSMQVFDMAPKQGKWVDIGSGGGFPGIVAAILSQGEKSKHDFILVESDQRKSVFLRTAIRELELKAIVRSERIEVMEPLRADILSARALADLSVLLGFARLHLHDNGIALFPKGARWQKEVETARLQWSYSCDPTTSRTNPSAAVLLIKDIARV